MGEERGGYGSISPSTHPSNFHSVNEIWKVTPWKNLGSGNYQTNKPAILNWCFTQGSEGAPHVEQLIKTLWGPTYAEQFANDKVLFCIETPDELWFIGMYQNHHKYSRRFFNLSSSLKHKIHPIIHNAYKVTLNKAYR